MKVEVRAWLKTGEYLPEPLRDFHDQKTLFKWLSLVHKRDRDRKLAAGERVTSDEFQWVNCHIWVIDYFLWFMAAMGYTLQRSRKRLPFDDPDAEWEEMRQEWQAECVRANPEFYGVKPEDVETPTP